MSLQRFYASPDDTFTWSNGAVGHRSGGPFDCVGPYAKVRNVPVHGTTLRITAYATGYADTVFSIPAACKIAGRYVGGFFTFDKDANYEDVLVFCPLDKFKNRIPPASVIPPVCSCFTVSGVQYQTGCKVHEVSQESK